MKKPALKKLNKRPIALATHVFNNVDFDVYFNHLYCMREWSQKYELILLGLKGLQAATARENLTNLALEHDCSHILFVDGDHKMPAELLDILWQSKDCAMVSGLVNKKGEEFQQVGWGSMKDGRYVQLDLPINGQVFEVQVCAFGCTLINLDILKKKLKPPYFRDTCEKGPDSELHNVRSDVNLCNMFRKAGELVKIDTRVIIGHDGISITIYPQNAKLIKKCLEMIEDGKELKQSQTGFYYK